MAWTWLTALPGLAKAALKVLVLAKAKQAGRDAAESDQAQKEAHARKAQQEAAAGCAGDLNDPERLADRVRDGF